MARTQGGLGGILWRASVRNGVWGGQSRWLTVFAVLATVKLVRRLAGSVQEVVFTQELKPGESFIITHHAGVHADLRLGDEPR